MDTQVLPPGGRWVFISIWPPVTQRYLSEARPDLGSTEIRCGPKAEGSVPGAGALHRDRCCLPSSSALQKRTEFTCLHRKTQEMNCFWASAPHPHTLNNEKPCPQFCSQVFSLALPSLSLHGNASGDSVAESLHSEPSQMENGAICTPSLSGFLKNKIPLGYMYYISGGLLP